jgi:hypothetical protein
MEDLVSDGDTLSSAFCQAFGRRKTIFKLFLALPNVKNRSWSALSRQATRNLSGKIHRWSLISSNSAFRHLFSAGQDDALITITGFNYAKSHELLQHFSPLCYQYTPHVASGLNTKQLPGLNNPWGWFCTIFHVIALSLYLLWTRMRGSNAAL